MDRQEIIDMVAYLAPCGQPIYFAGHAYMAAMSDDHPGEVVIWWGVHSTPQYFTLDGERVE